jgi:putative pyruvate formate lyase activating enzyme
MQTRTINSIKAPKPPHFSKVFVSGTGELVVTDLWTKWKEASDSQPRLKSLPSLDPQAQIGVNDFGILRGEEPPIDRGRGTGAVYIHGCPLRCHTCYQPEFFAKKARMQMEAEELAQIFLALQEQGAATLSIVMATLQKPVVEALHIARDRGLNLDAVLNYSGWISVAQLEGLGSEFQVYLPDLKAVGPEYQKHHGLSESYSKTTKEGILYLAKRGHSLIVRHLILPFLADPLSDLRSIVAWMLENRLSFPVSVLSQYFCPSKKVLMPLKEPLKVEIEQMFESAGLALYLQGRKSYDYSI